jgi:hypothetical protein
MTSQQLRSNGHSWSVVPLPPLTPTSSSGGPARADDVLIRRGLKFGTYLGGADDDEYNATRLAFGPDGSMFVAGTTFSTDFPITPGAFDTTTEGEGDLFVSKLDPTGSMLLYSTFLGGTGLDDLYALEVGADGSAYVGGFTSSQDFPTTPDSYSPTANGSDAFIARLDPSGSSLIYATYLGGSENADKINGLALAPDGTVYATGQTLSEDFPTTPGAFDRVMNDDGQGGVYDAFVSVLDPDGSDLIYSTFLGGDHSDYGHALTVAADGTAYVTGEAQSTDFPTTPGAFDETYNGGGDPFITRLSPDGSDVAFSTFIGGEAIDTGKAITLGAGRDVYITGNTSSTTYPTTLGAFDRTFNGLNDAFATKLEASGASLIYSTFLGGGNTDSGKDLAIDPGGSLNLVGNTNSPDFPTTPRAFDRVMAGTGDAFVSRLDPTGARLAYSSFLGANGIVSEEGLAMARVGPGVVTVAGWTASTHFPTTVGAYDRTFNGVIDVFVATLRVARTMHVDAIDARHQKVPAN